METEVKGINVEELKQLIMDVALIKNILLSEGELTEWAKNELEVARKRGTKLSHDEVKRIVLAK